MSRSFRVFVGYADLPLRRGVCRLLGLGLAPRRIVSLRAAMASALTAIKNNVVSRGFTMSILPACRAAGTLEERTGRNRTDAVAPAAVVDHAADHRRVHAGIAVHRRRSMDGERVDRADAVDAIPRPSRHRGRPRRTPRPADRRHAAKLAAVRRIVARPARTTRTRRSAEREQVAADGVVRCLVHRPQHPPRRHRALSARRRDRRPVRRSLSGVDQFRHHRRARSVPAGRRRAGRLRCPGQRAACPAAATAAPRNV